MYINASNLSHKEAVAKPQVHLRHINFVLRPGDYT
jgi:hypothetical protein